MVLPLGSNKNVSCAAWRRPSYRKSGNTFSFTARGWWSLCCSQCQRSSSLQRCRHSCECRECNPVPPRPFSDHRRQCPPKTRLALGFARRAQSDFEVLHVGCCRSNSRATSGDATPSSGVTTQTDDGLRPSAESPVVIGARDRLLATLDSLGRLLPGDRWILGQRLRYLSSRDDKPQAWPLAARRIPNRRHWAGVWRSRAIRHRNAATTVLERAGGNAGTGAM
jgi:hypothetical protein